MRCSVLFCNIIFYLNFLSKPLSTEKSEILRVIGGSDADESKYPYIVKLEYQFITYEGDKIIDQKHTCIASVLIPTWTLIAAHCFEIAKRYEYIKYTLRPVIVYGSHNNNNTFSIVTDIIKHPSYSFRLQRNVFNDIAMIKHEPISLNQYARVSGLDYVTMIGQEVTLFGYGLTTKLVNLSNKTSSHNIAVVDVATTLGKPLQFLDGLVVKCNDLNVRIKPVMCVARRCGKVTTMCHGDSGGPVLHDSGVVGVISGGQEHTNEFCYLKPFPPFYDAEGIMPTSPYIDWISSLIRNEVPTKATSGNGN